MKKLLLSLSLLATLYTQATWDDADMRTLMSNIHPQTTEESFNAALARLYDQHDNPELSTTGLTFLKNALLQWKNKGFAPEHFLTYVAFIAPYAEQCPVCPPVTVCPECPECLACPQVEACPPCPACPDNDAVLEPVVTEPSAPESTPSELPTEQVAPAENTAPQEVTEPVQPTTPEAMVADLVAQVQQTAELIQAVAQDPVVAEQLSEDQVKHLRAALTKAMRALKKAKEQV